jgi:hypothetical protein
LFEDSCGGKLVAIRLPDLTTSGCKVLIVCGRTEDRETVSKMKRLKSLAAMYRTGGHSTQIRIVFETEGTYGHVHIELVSREFWGKADDPKPVSKLSEVQAALKVLEDVILNADVDGYFTVPIADLPPIIRSATEEVKVRDVSIKMTSGTLTVRGAPIERIEWRTSAISDDAVVILHSKKSVRIHSEFLYDALNVLAPAFSVLIKGRQPNGGKEK